VKYCNYSPKAKVGIKVGLKHITRKRDVASMVELVRNKGI
jgi:hypothetical protein